MFRVFTYFRSFVCSYFLSFLSLFPFAHSTCHDSSFREYHGSIDVFASRRGYELQSDIHKYRWQNNTHVFHEHIFFYISSVFFSTFCFAIKYHFFCATAPLELNCYIGLSLICFFHHCRHCRKMYKSYFQEAYQEQFFCGDSTVNQYHL